MNFFDSTRGMGRIFIPDWGSLDSPFILVGESGGWQEERLKAPFVGESGKMLDRWWAGEGLNRNHFYITNLFPYRPPKAPYGGSKSDMDMVPLEVLTPWVDRLHQRIAKVKGAKMIVTLGAYSTNAVMRRPLRGQKAARITEWRGSILRYRDLNGRPLKHIPSLHPSAIMRKPTWTQLSLYDWKRIRKDVEFPQLRHPKAEHLIHPSKDDKRLFLAEVEEAWEKVRQKGRWDQDRLRTALSVDIETNPKKREIVCIGFGLSPDFSLSVPWRGNKRFISSLLQTPIPKLGQNFQYDAFWLAHEEMPVRNWRWDTMNLHHQLEPDLPHSLGVQASLRTRQPFWKRDHKESDGGKVSFFNSSMDELLRYNGVDVTTTTALMLRYQEELGV